MSHHTSQFVNLLSEDNGVLASNVLALVDTSELDKFIQPLTRVMAARGLATSLLDTLMKDEVTATEGEGTLFRRNSPATKMATAYGLLTGKAYLKSVLEAPLKRAIAQAQHLEIDPARQSKNQDLAASQAALLAAAEDVLSAIIGALDKCPPQVRGICRIIADATRAKFPNASIKAVGGFVFLRFFVPAITVPEGFDVLSKTTINPSQRRALVLVAKSIQGLANGVEFSGLKEGYLAPMNPFVTGNAAKMNDYLTAMAAPVAGWKETQYVSGDFRPMPILDDEIDSIEKGITEILSLAGLQGPAQHIAVDVIQDSTGDPKDLEALATTLDRLEPKIKAAPLASSSRGKLLIKIIDDRKQALAAAGTAAGAATAAMLKAESGGTLSYDPMDAKIEKEGNAAGGDLMRFLGLNWTEADEVGGVKVYFMTEPVKGLPDGYIMIKAEVRIERSVAFTLQALQNIPERAKWDTMIQKGHNELHKVGPTKVVQLVNSDPAVDFICLERISPPIAAMGAAITYVSTISRAKPSPAGTQRGDLAPSGFVIRPVSTNADVCYVNYILSIKYPGVSTDDAWGPAMNTVMAVGSLRDQCGCAPAPFVPAVDPVKRF